MPVMRGSLRPSGDGSIKSFVIILTVIGFLCFIYYKLKLSPGCVAFMAEITAQRAEISRLTALVKNLDELIQNQKEENRKVVAQKSAKDQDLAAARAVEIDGLKQIAQLKNDLRVAGSKLENCGPEKNLGMSCTEMEEKYKQEIMDLKSMNLQLKMDSRKERKHDSAKDVPEYPQKEFALFTYKQNLPSDMDKQIFHKNDGRDSVKEERNELLNTVEFTSNNSSKSKIHHNFEETFKPLKSEDEEKEEILNIPDLTNLKAKNSKLTSKKLSYSQEEPAIPEGMAVGQIPRIKSGEQIDFRNKNQKPSDNDDKQVEGKDNDHQRIIGKHQKDSINDENQSLKDQPEYDKVAEGFKDEHEKDGVRLRKEQLAFGNDHSQNPSYYIKDIKRKRHGNQSINGNDSKRGHNRSDDDRHEAGIEQDKNDRNNLKNQAKLKDEEVQQVPDAWGLPGLNESAQP